MAAIPNTIANFAQGQQRRPIPFDYSFTFNLKGQPENMVSSTVTVSVEGSFIATSIGYGFVTRAEPVRFGGRPADLFPAGTGNARGTTGPLTSIQFGAVLTLANRKFGEAALAAQGVIGPRTAAILESGFRINPDVVNQVLLGGTATPVDAALLDNLFEVVAPSADDIQFLYALSDQGTGREFQSEPVLNTAGLGSAKGQRPFRQFASPIAFSPRTNIKMEVTELQTLKGKLYVSLHGYKLLGQAGTPTGPAVGAGVTATAAAQASSRRRRR